MLQISFTLQLQFISYNRIYFYQGLMFNKVKQAMQNYAKQNKRIKYKLTFAITFLLQSKNPQEEIRRCIKETIKPLQLFKLLIFMHECLLSNGLNSQQSIELLFLIKSQARPKEGCKLDQIICSKIIPDYTLYLQKCYQARTQSNYKTQQSQQYLYKNINLLKQGLSFGGILNLFGRYYLNTYLFITDFNAILARDFVELYEAIKKILKKNKVLWTESMRLEIERIHEKMYIVFCNCYYSKEVKQYIPRWIDTQTFDQHELRKSKKKQKENLFKSFDFDKQKKQRTKRLLKKFSLNIIASNHQVQLPNPKEQKILDTSSSQYSNIVLQKSMSIASLIKIGIQQDQNELEDTLDQKNEAGFELMVSLHTIINEIEDKELKRTTLSETFR